MIEDVMGDTQTVGHGSGVGNIVARAAGTLAPGCRTVIIQLQCYADYFRSALRCQRSNNGRVDAARHRHDYPPVCHRPGQVEQVGSLGRRKGQCIGHGAYIGRETGLRKVCEKAGDTRFSARNVQSSR